MLGRLMTLVLVAQGNNLLPQLRRDNHAALGVSVIGRRAACCPPLGVIRLPVSRRPVSRPPQAKEGFRGEGPR
jgi:hypothetical protein